MAASSSVSPKNESFFFARETPYGLALVRILLPLAAGFPMMMRAFRVRELFTTDGATAQLPLLNGWGNALPVFSPAVAIPLYGTMLACLLMTSVGFRPRLSLLIATPLYIYFNLIDAVGTLTKYSVIASHLFLILSVSQCGSVWSIDAILKRRQNRTSVPPTTEVWPARLIQILFAFIYFGAAITKLQTDGFFNGAQMRYWMLSNWNYANPIGEAMAMWTPLLLIGSYLTLLWELSFCMLVWQKRTRPVVLVLGVGFHLSTWLLLGLYVFPAICLAAYAAFLTERDIVQLRAWLTRWKVQPVFAAFEGSIASASERLLGGLPAGVAWSCLIGLAAIGLMEVEVRSDLYGLESTESGYELKPVDSATAKSMIADQRPIREQDKFFDFSLGTVTIGNHVANRVGEFTYGDVIHAQCVVNPPHDDLWVECVLQDDGERTIEQFGQFVSREMLKADFKYHVGNKLVPGQYKMILKSGNKAIAERPFTLTGTPPSQPVVLTN